MSPLSGLPNNQLITQILGATEAHSEGSPSVVYRGEHGAFEIPRDLKAHVSTGLVKEYYFTPGARELAHRLKLGDVAAIEQIALDMRPQIPEGAVLVPVPGHSGKAGHTLLLAEAIARITPGAVVENVLAGAPRKSLYEIKRDGESLGELEFSLIRPVNGRVILVDGVMDTGTTLEAARKCLPHAGIAVHSIQSGNKNIPFTKKGMFTFSSDSEVASEYAIKPNDNVNASVVLSPRVYAGFVTIQKPIINTPDDPFFDMSVIAENFGRDKALYFANKHENYMEHTNNWEEISEKTGFRKARDFLKVFPDRVNDLYCDAYAIVDDPEFIELIQSVGFDGAIHGGAGIGFESAEFKVVSHHQFVPMHCPMEAINRNAVVYRRALVAKQEIIADMEQGIVPRSVKSFAELHDYVDANMYFSDADRVDTLSELLCEKEGWKGEKEGWEPVQQYCDLWNEVMERVDDWLKAHDFENHPHFTKPSTDALFLNIVANTETAAFADLGERYELLRSLDAARLAMSMGTGDQREFQLLDTNGNVFGAVSISNSSLPDIEKMNFHLAINMNLAVIDQSRAAYLLQKVIEEWSDDEPGFTNGESGTFELFGKEVGVLNIIKAREPEHRLENSADMESASASL